MATFNAVFEMKTGADATSKIFLKKAVNDELYTATVRTKLGIKDGSTITGQTWSGMTDDMNVPIACCGTEDGRYVQFLCALDKTEEVRAGALKGESVKVGTKATKVGDFVRMIR